MFDMCIRILKELLTHHAPKTLNEIRLSWQGLLVVLQSYKEEGISGPA